MDDDPLSDVPPLTCPDDGVVLHPLRDGYACPECGYWLPYDEASVGDGIVGDDHGVRESGDTGGDGGIDGDGDVRLPRPA